MQLGYIGLGKMGSHMVERLLEKDHEVIAYDVRAKAREAIAGAGAKTAESIQHMVEALAEPRSIWIMVPHAFVEDVLGELLPELSEGDTIIEAGNSPYTDSMRRAKDGQKRGVRFLDVGVSGGPWGARNGACMMVGGEKAVYEEYVELFRDLNVEGGFGYMGASGAGHFVKMVHNGIEYGMMQAIAEGFHVMKCSPFDLSLTEIARVYNHGSVIESRLMGWMQKAFEEHGEDLEKVSGTAAASGEGEWTVTAAHELGIPDNVIHEALTARATSELHPNYQGKVISALRGQFGGHEVKKEEG